MPKKFIFLSIIVVIVFGVSLDYLSQRIFRLETELKPLRSLPSQNFFLQMRVKTLQSIISHEMFSGQGDIHAFKSSQDKEAIDDTFISEDTKTTNFNWGESGTLKIGRDHLGHLSRALIRFKEIKKALSLDLNRQILSAIVYLKQQPNFSQGLPALKQVLNLYEVKKNWGEGNKMGVPAAAGESTWNAAQKASLNWESPGCSGKDDFDEVTLVATSGPTVNSFADGWVGFVFTKEGILELQQQLQSATSGDYSFLIQSQEEDSPNSAVSFYSSESSTLNDHPYIEILYVDLY